VLLIHLTSTATMTYLTKRSVDAIFCFQRVTETAMNDVLIAFENITPLLRRCRNGGWLAVAPDESPIHIGVFAWSMDEARNRFNRARAEWRILLEEALHETIANSSAKENFGSDRRREPAIS
jgi:hypothetical protein